MISDFLLNHLWQSTLFAVAAALLTLAFRKNHARVRYALWLAASIKFLIPFSLIIAIGSSLDFGWRQDASKMPATISIAGNICQPFGSAGLDGRLLSATPVSKQIDSTLRLFILSVWILGSLAVLFAYLKKAWRAKNAVRRAILLTSGIEVESLRDLLINNEHRVRIQLAASKSQMEPGVFGIFTPVLVLPAGMTVRLTNAELEAILVHELAHIRRYDNLFAAIQMLIEVLFWFHPIIWWLGAKLVEERERACDEAVLQSGKDPQSYAEGILKVCEFCLESPLACVAGITGSDMKKRIHAIMSHHIGGNLSVAKKLVLAMACLAALVVPVVIGLLSAPPSQAQSQTGPKPSFEVASVKPSKDWRGIAIQMQPGGRMVVNGATLSFLIAHAYEIQPFQISGGPTWTYSSPYDIEAKSSGPVSPAQIKLMLQLLLEERFKLKMHRETRDMPVYELVVPKGGHELKITKNDKGSVVIGEPIPPQQPPIGPEGKPMVQPPGSVWQLNGQLQGKAIPLDEVAKMLSRIVGRTVIDKTGLTGAYDFSLKWTPDNAQPNPLNAANTAANNSALSADLSEPSILTAIQEQLGLKLEPSKGQGEFFIIDSAEKPSEN